MRLAWMVLASLLLLEPAEAATFYVGKSGSNANSCTTAQSSTAANRKLTIGNTNGSGGVGCLNDPGDTLIVGNGTYVETQIQITRSDLTNGVGGTLANPITIRAENKQLAIISSTSSCNPNISYYASYITVDGLSLVEDPTNIYCTPNSAAGTGIRMWPDGGAQGGVAQNIKTDDPTGPNGKIRSHGIKTNQPNSIVQDNEPLAGIESLNADNLIIRRNTIGTGSTGGGEWGHGIVTKGGGHNVQVYQNYVNLPLQAGWGILLGGSNASDNPVQECWNCVAFDNIVRVAAGSGNSMGFQGCKDCAFWNNVGFGGSFHMTTAPSSSNLSNTWKNNILDCQGSNAIGTLQDTYTIDYNLFYNCTGVPSQVHAIVGNPQFVNPASDYHLQTGSPAIGAGVVGSFLNFTNGQINISFDYDNVVRTIPWSLGIYKSAGIDFTPPAAPSGVFISKLLREKE